MKKLVFIIISFCTATSYSKGIERYIYASKFLNKDGGGSDFGTRVYSDSNVLSVSLEQTKAKESYFNIKFGKEIPFTGMGDFLPYIGSGVELKTNEAALTTGFVYVYQSGGLYFGTGYQMNARDSKSSNNFILELSFRTK
jgi:hypothetical protein